MKNYVKEYKGYDVPEGATHYAKNAMFLFYKIISGSPYFYDRFIGEWRISSGDCFDSAIELPEEPKADEWVPSGRCIHVYTNSNVNGVAKVEEEEVNIIGIDKLGNYVFQNDKSACYYSDPASEFRPLKTKEEKKREVFIENAKRVARTTDDVLTHDRLFGLLFDSGAEFTAPKEGE